MGCGASDESSRVEHESRAQGLWVPVGTVVRLVWEHLFSLPATGGFSDCGFTINRPHRVASDGDKRSPDSGRPGPPGAPAEPRCGGIGPRRDDALLGGDRGGQRRPGRTTAASSTARATRRSSAERLPCTPRASRSTRSRSSTSSTSGASSRTSAARSASTSWRRWCRRAPMPATTRRSSRRRPPCAGSSASAARSPAWAGSGRARLPSWSTAPSRSSSISRRRRPPPSSVISRPS